MAIKKTNQLRFCPCCNMELTADNFYESANPRHGGYLLYCKDHCNEINREFKEKTQDQAKALWFTCQVLDVPFILDVYKKFAENKDRKIKERQEKIDQKTGKKQYNAKEMVNFIENYKDFYNYYDTLRKTNSGADDWTTFYSGTNVEWKDVSNNIKELEVKESEKQKFILDWGFQEDIDDYIFLEYQFDELTEGKTLSKPQEMLYRDLCVARLTKRKIDSGIIKDGNVKQTQDQILQLMSKLKIDNFAEERDKSDIDKILEKQIWEIENTEPAELIDKEEYKDFLGIGNTWYNHIVRAVKNLVAGGKDYPDVTKDEWD